MAAIARSSRRTKTEASTARIALRSLGSLVSAALSSAPDCIAFSQKYTPYLGSNCVLLAIRVHTLQRVPHRRNPRVVVQALRRKVGSLREKWLDVESADARLHHRQRSLAE